ncbi:hypothetical protein [Novosphingobium beihaiensis]|uniref:Uncharacterized protein n=1 Tax=Novosphingobium beihaiensis TaxID=2930389 RepID=A0ABT0BNS0_9SPHN|nr:hypothetical protein [Novosphingobium beihaiensis]MCJ2186481.1 hypothetical protein [Novosphingobium beihaiensis]
MSNVAGKAYAMNVITPMPPGVTWINRFLFMIARALPATLSGLLGLGLIHFARWVIIRRDQWPQMGQPPASLANDYMLFCSNFNGTWDQYIDAFADGIPGGLDLFWYASSKYPNSIPITPFKGYIRANQIDTNYYYNATPGSGQRDIKLALKLSNDLQKVAAQLSSLSDEELTSAFERVLIVNQGGLGSPGYAPVASYDTAAADRNRAEAEAGRWGAGGEGAIRAGRDVQPLPAAAVLASSVDEDAAAKAAVSAAANAVLGTAPRLAEAPKVAEPDSRRENVDA